MRNYVLWFLIFAFTCTASTASAEKPTATAAAVKAVFWVDPGDIQSRDLLYGVGGKAQVPQGPFAFVEEDKNGASAKFEVTDGSGQKWKAKIGPEAQPEVVATRLLWALGFVTNENYYLANTPVAGISKQKRGREAIGDNEVVRGMRLQRAPKNHKKTKEFWHWAKNPAEGTREFNGLRVMMALLSNWDLKDDNNGIYQSKDDSSRLLYGVSDVGSSFGTSGKGFRDSTAKNNLQAYARNKFVAKVSDKHVDFNFPTHPSFVHYFPLFQFPIWWRHSQQRWIGRKIPREDVKWVAGLLTQLTPGQIRDAFRAGGYSKEQVEAYADAVQHRIAEIAKL